MATTYSRSSPQVMRAFLHSSSRSGPQNHHLSQLPRFKGPFDSRNPPIRSIHSQTLYHVSVQSTEAIITGLHTFTHTPWCLTIPLVALGVNAFFRLPFTIHSQRIFQRRAQLSPLVQSWFWRTKKDGSRGPSMSIPKKAEEEFDKIYEKRTKRLYKEFSVQSWKHYLSISILPFWLLAIESIRRLCGNDMGLLGMILSQGDLQAAAPSTLSSPHFETGSASSSLSLDTLPAETRMVPSEAALDVTNSMTSDPVSEMMTEGCLWFPDLTVADRLHVLPVMLSAMLIVSSIPSTKAGWRALFGLAPAPAHRDLATRNAGSVSSLRIQRALLILSAMVGPLTMGLPAALHLYWLSTSTTTYLLRYAVRKAMPVKTAVEKPCIPSRARFIRIRRKRQA